jgi:hypothetical protein
MKFVIFIRNLVLADHLLINYNDAIRGAISTQCSLVASPVTKMLANNERMV